MYLICEHRIISLTQQLSTTEKLRRKIAQYFHSPLSSKYLIILFSTDIHCNILNEHSNIYAIPCRYEVTKEYPYNTYTNTYGIPCFEAISVTLMVCMNILLSQYTVV